MATKLDGSGGGKALVTKKELFIAASLTYTYILHTYILFTAGNIFIHSMETKANKSSQFLHNYTKNDLKCSTDFT